MCWRATALHQTSPAHKQQSLENNTSCSNRNDWQFSMNRHREDARSVGMWATRSQQRRQEEEQPFHIVIGRVLRIAQIFAVLPVSNADASDVAMLRYSWLSGVCIYAIVVFILNGLEFLFFLNLVCSEGLNFHTSGTLALFAVCLLEHVYFWRLAIKWPHIMSVWRHTERPFQRPPYSTCDGNSRLGIKASIYVSSSVIMLCALLEHTLLVSNSFHQSELEHMQCHLNISYWESVYRHERYHLSVALPLRIWLLPLFEWINLTLAFVRSFTDVFIICISIALAAQYRRLYARIRAVHKRALPSVFWREVHRHYIVLQRLLRLVNRSLSPLIVLACANNMYFICFQLFNSFQNIGGDVMAMLAFWFSLAFAIGRTLFTLYVAATLHNYSEAIRNVLYEVPSACWCAEIERFSEQLANDVTALSGDGFFFLTRQLILVMTSTIVTYEVLVADLINHNALRQRTNYCN